MPFLPEFSLRYASVTALCLLCGCASMFDVSSGPLANGIGRPAVDGRRIYAELTSQHPGHSDPDANREVQRVGQQLAAGSGGVSWTFQVVSDERPLAAALPGHRVVVSDALLAHCRSEGELAAVLAQQMGHLLAGHGFDRLKTTSAHQNATSPDMLAAFGYADPPGFSQEQQIEAVSIGLSLLVTAGFDPEFMIQRVPASGDGAAPDSPAADFATTVANARSVYQSHAHKRGQGTQLAYHRQPTAPERETVPNNDLWSQTIAGGGGKPTGWNADLQGEAWEQPLPSDVVPASFEGPALER